MPLNMCFYIHINTAVSMCHAKTARVNRQLCIVSCRKYSCTSGHNVRDIDMDVWSVFSRKRKYPWTLDKFMYTLLKPRRHELRCHGFVVHALLLRMKNNVVDLCGGSCHRVWNWQSVNHIPGIHDNGPRDHDLWRLTLTAYHHTTRKMLIGGSTPSTVFSRRGLFNPSKYTRFMSVSNRFYEYIVLGTSCIDSTRKVAG